MRVRRPRRAFGAGLSLGLALAGVAAFAGCVALTYGQPPGAALPNALGLLLLGISAAAALGGLLLGRTASERIGRWSVAVSAAALVPITLTAAFVLHYYLRR